MSGAPVVDGRLLVFAHEDEARAFESIPHLVTGIGKIRAATELTRALLDGAVDRVTVLGTAGLLDDDLDLDTVYRIHSVLQHDFALPSPTYELESFRGEAGDVPSAVLATGDAFISDDVDRRRLADLGAALVDMESYAYAHVCHRFGVDLEIFKVPSDFADSETTQQTWDDIVAQKSEELFRFAGEHGLFEG